MHFGVYCNRARKAYLQYNSVSNLSGRRSRRSLFHKMYDHYGRRTTARMFHSCNGRPSHIICHYSNGFVFGTSRAPYPTIPTSYFNIQNRNKIIKAVVRVITVPLMHKNSCHPCCLATFDIGVGVITHHYIFSIRI